MTDSAADAGASEGAGGRDAEREGMIARLKTLALGVLAALVAIGAALLYRKGKQAQKQADAAASAKQTIHAHEVRDEVDAEVSKLPDAPPQKVADADPGTAAGQLRDDGWVRDD